MITFSFLIWLVGWLVIKSHCIAKDSQIPALASEVYELQVYVTISSKDHFKTCIKETFSKHKEPNKENTMGVGGGKIQGWGQW